MGFFFTADGDEEDPFLEDLLSKSPTSDGTALGDLEIQEFLDDHVEGHIFSYNGSLTTPPCTEGIKWSVVEKAVPMSKAQLKLFNDKWLDNDGFARGKGNNRVVQPLNDRTLLEGLPPGGPNTLDDHGHDHDHDHDGAAMIASAAGAALFAIAAIF